MMRNIEFNIKAQSFRATELLLLLFFLLYSDIPKLHNILVQLELTTEESYEQ